MLLADNMYINNQLADWYCLLLCKQRCHNKSSDTSIMELYNFSVFFPYFYTLHILHLLTIIVQTLEVQILLRSVQFSSIIYSG